MVYYECRLPGMRSFTRVQLGRKSTHKLSHLDTEILLTKSVDDLHPAKFVVTPFAKVSTNNTTIDILLFTTIVVALRTMINFDKIK